MVRVVWTVVQVPLLPVVWPVWKVMSWPLKNLASSLSLVKTRGSWRMRTSFFALRA